MSGEQMSNFTATFGETTSSGALASGVRISETFTAQQELDHSTEHKYGSSSSVSTKFDQTTELNDVIGYQDGVNYIYVYEVAGKKVCPAANTRCSDAQKVPLTVMFSAPGAITTGMVSGDAAEWYQPALENGNILSYPWATSQLYTNLNKPIMLDQNQLLATDGSETNSSTTWANTSDSGRRSPTRRCSRRTARRPCKARRTSRSWAMASRGRRS